MSDILSEREALIFYAEQRGYARAMEAERKLHEARISAQAAEIERLRSALKKAEAQSLVLESVARGPIKGERMIIWIKYHMKEARAALAALTGAKP